MYLILNEGLEKTYVFVAHVAPFIFLISTPCGFGLQNKTLLLVKKKSITIQQNRGSEKEFVSVNRIPLGAVS
jgi:hypothetical protein